MHYLKTALINLNGIPIDLHFLDADGTTVSQEYVMSAEVRPSLRVMEKVAKTDRLEDGIDFKPLIERMKGAAGARLPTLPNAEDRPALLWIAANKAAAAALEDLRIKGIEVAIYKAEPDGTLDGLTVFVKRAVPNVFQRKLREFRGVDPLRGSDRFLLYRVPVLMFIGADPEEVANKQRILITTDLRFDPRIMNPRGKPGVHLNAIDVEAFYNNIMRLGEGNQGMEPLGLPVQGLTTELLKPQRYGTIDGIGVEYGYERANAIRCGLRFLANRIGLGSN